MNGEIEKDNLSNPANSSTLLENNDLANGSNTCKKISLILWWFQERHGLLVGHFFSY